jgi:probable rRNA maturation factor
MAIRFSNHHVKFSLKNKRRIRNWIKEITNQHSKIAGDIEIIFTSESYILEINSQYLNHNFYTDIITFDYSDGNLIEGDIYISIDTVLSNSKKYKTEFNEELLRVIIHGILHLIGFTDKKSNEKREMTLNENEALKRYFKKDEQRV